LKRIEALNPDWIPEDAYHLLRMGLPNGAVLSLIADDGFLIWQRYPGDDGRGMLFVLALAAYEGHSLLKHYKTLNAELDELAAKMNCKRIRHISKHEQWADLGWSLLGHVYEREL
jgi:hypothetical protein